MLRRPARALALLAVAALIASLVWWGRSGSRTSASLSSADVYSVSFIGVVRPERAGGVHGGLSVTVAAAELGVRMR